MIDYKQLKTLKNGFLLLSQILDFPEAEILSPSFLTEAENLFPEIPEKADFLSNLTALQEQNLQSLQENYTSLFELNKRVTLYCTYYKLKDSREQGNVMAKLKMLYEMFGVELEQSELTDYLPTMLEFLGVGEFDAEDERIDDLNLLFSIIEDGTYEILQHAQEFDDEPYIKLVKIVRNTVKHCMIQERITA